MGFFVRAADLRQDRQDIITLHRKFLTPLSDDVRFDWLYHGNPFGPPLVWVVQDSSSGDLIGTAGAFYRSLWDGEKKHDGWVLGDFCVSDAYRSLGPALQLQRACLEGICENPSQVWYDFPSQNMLAIYKRLKILPAMEMIRFVKPLKVDRKVQSLVGSTILQRGLSACGNMALDWSRRNVTVGEGITFHRHEEEFGEEFTELCQFVKGSHGRCLDRNASYLNWKYFQNPMYHCEVITVRLNATLKGYAVLSDNKTDVKLVDVFGVGDDGILTGLIDHVISLARTRGRESLSVALGEGHFLEKAFQAVGFKPRDSTPVIVNWSSKGSQERHVDNISVPFLLMQGDRDI